jgi:hypothetical protein
MRLHALYDARAGACLYERTGLTVGGTGERNEFLAAPRASDRAPLILQHRDATAALGAIRRLRRDGQPAKFKQQLA